MVVGLLFGKGVSNRVLTVVPVAMLIMKGEKKAE
jgi:hypothetical protein